MSDTEKDKEFYEMADAYIDVANKQGEKNITQGKVSATILYAAARFNTFLVASNSESADDLASRKEEACTFFMAEYQKMLDEHFADYIENFDKYLK
ncbi:MAG: DUF3144 domain-containing protein [Thermodesulfobacteriota bacterium]